MLTPSFPYFLLEKTVDSDPLIAIHPKEKQNKLSEKTKSLSENSIWNLGCNVSF